MAEDGDSVVPEILPTPSLSVENVVYNGSTASVSSCVYEQGLPSIQRVLVFQLHSESILPLCLNKQIVCYS